MTDIPVITTDANVIVTFDNNQTITVAVEELQHLQVPSDWNATSGVTRIMNKPTQLSYWVEDTTHRVVTDTEKTYWNQKIDSNTPIVAGTNTKISYDVDGLVTSSSAATQDDIGDGTTYKQYSDTEKIKLAGIASGAEVNVNSDWNSISGDSEILNKPTTLSYWTEDSTHRVVTDSDKTNWNGKLDANTPISGSTHTKITYDNDGLVTSGSNATQDDIGDGVTFKQFSLTEQTKLSGIASGAEVNVNSDWNSSSGDSQILNKPTTLAYWTDDATHRTVTDTEKSTWNGKQDALGYVPVQSNVAITGATNTKISFDSKGLVTGGVNATQDDIGDGTTYKQYSQTEKTKLSGIAAGAEVNVNADWNSVSGDSQILNKPTIPSAQVSSDWNSVVSPTSILNKPTTLAYWTDDTTHRTVTDTEKTTWNGKLTPNVAIVGATKTKISYDSNGLITSGADIASSDISDFGNSVRATLLTGLSLVTNAVISATDSILVALGNLQAQITNLKTKYESISTKTTTYETTALDNVILGDTTSAGFTITLLTPTGNSGIVQSIKNIGANPLTVSGTIDGASDLVLSQQYQGVILKCDGVGWYILGRI